MLNFEKINDEVLYSTDPITRTDDDDIRQLVSMALDNPRRRIRLCAHPDTDDTLHEMLIVHCRGNYVPPHRHRAKSESFHMIEGALTVVIFEDDGAVAEVIPMAPRGGDGVFFYRLSDCRYHTVVPTTDFVVFHEITNGPFQREDMEFAPWAPGEDAPPPAQREFVDDLTRRYF